MNVIMVKHIITADDADGNNDDDGDGGGGGNDDDDNVLGEGDFEWIN